jgi:hypothetical protein
MTTLHIASDSHEENYHKDITMKNSLLISICCLIALGCVIGCGSKNPLGVVKVTGKVTMDGQPVSGAQITFIPKSGGSGTLCGATTDSEGVYSLMTPSAGEAKGAVPGEYEITIIKITQEASPEDSIPSEERTTPTSQAPPKIIKHLPMKYEKTSTSGLSETVAKGGKNVFDFDLKKD